MKKNFLTNSLTHLLLLTFVIAWILPTFGLFISSFRDKDLLATSGWWTTFKTNKINEIYRTKTFKDQYKENGKFIIKGNLLDENSGKKIISYGITSKELNKYKINEKAVLKNKSEIEIKENGEYLWKSEKEFKHKRGKRIFITALSPPKFTLDNYKEVLFKEGIGQAFLNTLTVAIPSTIIPLIICSFFAYALSWMRFWGRDTLFAIIVASLVVPLQMCLIPLLSIYNDVGALFNIGAKSYPGVWMAHTGFGLASTTFLLRNFIKSLPHEMIEAARVDGATHYDIFLRIILPLSVPAFASVFILQFLWVWK
jgi:ABC-type sugar transport system, permease component